MLKLKLFDSRAKASGKINFKPNIPFPIFSQDFVQVEAEVWEPRRSRPQPRGDGGRGARDVRGDHGPWEAGALPPQQQDLPKQQVRGGQGQGRVT